MKYLNYLMDQTVYLIFKNYFKYILKRHDKVTDNPSITKYVNKIENRITFKTKTGYYIEILTSETIK